MASGPETGQELYELPHDEYVWRRIPESKVKEGWVQPDGRVDPNAFKPNKTDTDGLSLSRERTAEEVAATGVKGKRYYATKLRVGDIIQRIEVVADSPTHALVPGWTFEVRKSAKVVEGSEYLASICGIAEGPFEGKVERAESTAP